MDKYSKLNISNEALAKFDLPKFLESNRNLNAAIKNTNANFDEIYKQVQETNRAKLQREIEIHEATLRTADNTQGIHELVSLVRQGNDINKELFDLFQELNTMLLAQNEEEAKTILTKVLEKAVAIDDGVGAISSLASHGEVILQYLKMKYFI